MAHIVKNLTVPYIIQSILFTTYCRSYECNFPTRAFTLADWDFMVEMNNSVYGNPSSLTIHNEKNIKTGEYRLGEREKERYIFFYFFFLHNSFNVRTYSVISQITKLTTHFYISTKYLMQSSAVAIYEESNKHLKYIWQRYSHVSLDLCSKSASIIRISLFLSKNTFETRKQR